MNQNIIIDSTLTPENCDTRGYEYWSNVYYAAEDPQEVFNDLLERCGEGWSLGECASKTMGLNWYGFYKPKDGK